MSVFAPVPASRIRASLSAAMSAMYRNEVPAYDTLVDMVAEINAATLASDADLRDRRIRRQF